MFYICIKAHDIYNRDLIGDLLSLGSFPFPLHPKGQFQFQILGCFQMLLLSFLPSYTLTQSSPQLYVSLSSS